ncbi:two-component system, OmpR family, phosphate regulon response regulator PhoB [Candidatus Hakubella thermalkaliphila]|uniref:Two-component system, OmpR family, phosphate regulon response regulator PhoB n=1 Tax=Candidatus Hakubella thermalkaliphila TaxID=2754717 RepID=A0A6V8PVF4_9ACTN|nr:two-component system, OmpR family, phosphate regulon response regulator PhoB [Candidatus Hakubella thermalkaliphila]
MVAPADQILQALGRIFPEQEIRGVEPREERRVRLDLVLGEEKLPVVLLVQDDSLDLEIISRALINAGYRVIPCRDGAQALAKLNSVEPDAVITELEIPFVNGIKLTQEIRKQKAISHIPVIMLTSIEAEAEMVKAFSAGVDEYLVKPFNPRELVLRLKAMLARTKSGTPLSSKNSQQQS